MSLQKLVTFYCLCVALFTSAVLSSLNNGSWGNLDLVWSSGALVDSLSQGKLVGPSSNIGTMGTHTLSIYDSSLLLQNDTILSSDLCKVPYGGNDSFKVYLVMYLVCSDTPVALSRLLIMSDNDRNYNVVYLSKLCQICLDISEALINQICSDISEAFSNHSSRVIEPLVNLCSQLLKAIKLSMNTCSQLSQLKLLIWRLTYCDYFCSTQLTSFRWMSLFHMASRYMNPSEICRIIAIRAMRNCMLKHDYINIVCNSKGKPSHHNPLMFLMQAYPVHYIILCGLSYALYHIMLYMRFLSSTIVKTSETEVDDTLVATNPLLVGGGGRKSHITYGMLRPYILLNGSNANIDDSISYRFVSHVLYQTAIDAVSQNNEMLVCRMPLGSIINHLTLGQTKAVAKTHGAFVAYKASLPSIINSLTGHLCSKHCYDNVFVFKPAVDNSTATWRDSIARAKHRKNKNNSYSRSRGKASFKEKKALQNKNYYRNKKICKFPPSPPTNKLLHKIITGFCNDTHPSQFEEVGCAVCGQLTLKKNILPLKDVECSLEPLRQQGVTSIERKSELQDHQSLEGPVIDSDCVGMCTTCHKHLDRGNCPPMALANGFWIGKVPLELTGLTFVEKILISRVRHNRCIVRIASGRYKMRANAIIFQNPIPKLYNVLPPPLEELDQVLACVFTGPCQPTEKDIQRTPLLVRRKQVGKALQWLKLNHIDYYDIELSEGNLHQYPDNGTPVVIDYRQSILNRDKEAMSVHDNEEEEGVQTGDCSFVVHGLTGEEFSEMTLETIKARALEHLTKDGKIAFVGHASQPESIYNNPQLFPSMMPWLFPYGLGGIGNSHHQGRLSGLAHKKHLLMYHDKRFQMDPGFALIALNHEQIRESTTGGYLTADKAYFSQVSDRLHSLDLNVLTDISTRLSQNIRVKPETDAEKLCYKLLGDLEVVSGHVKGSVASKKYMRNEIWSLVSYVGAPSWFVTLSPADNKHPICLYFADTDEEFKPDIKLPDDTFRLVASNPAAAARFFDFMCQAFIKNVLGVGQKHPGIFGKTSAYYGTVEQQGRLTLHLHMLIWIKNALTPQEIRDRIMDQSSDFQQKMVEYIESVYKGEFFNGHAADVNQRVKEAQHNDSEYLDPTKTMPEAPPDRCHETRCNSCEHCEKLNNWWSRFRQTVDDLVLRSNVHSCRMSTKDKDGNDIKKGCLNKQGRCRAQFPRDVVEQTMVDPLTGALMIKKGEPWLNTFTPLITYLLRCNMDTTSLLSGTAIKAIIVYISDYVTKPGLKTYSIFDTIRSVFDRNSELITESTDRKSTARLLMTKIVNALTARMEIGSPMACMYLLGNPDHYTDHKFVNFYWRNYVQEVQTAWESPKEDDKPAKVVLNKNMGKYIGLSNVQDYMHRPFIYKDLNLYDWIRQSTKSKRSKVQQAEFDTKHEIPNEYDKEMIDDESDDETNDELDILNDNNVLDSNNPQLGGGYDLNISDFTDYDSLDEPADDVEDVDNETSDELNIGDENAQNLYEDEEEKHQFMKAHPQFRTHHVHCTNEDNIVPNFLGGSLPRCDQGDREYYCLTMLTLFKPWRSGKDLKSADSTWDETFYAHNFTSRQQQLMRNFNLRYECIDARDDYSAKLKKKDEEDSGLFLSWASSDVLKDLEQNSFVEYDDDNPQDINTEESMYIEPSSKHIKKLDEMNQMENIVRNAGWMDNCPQAISHIDSKGIDIQVKMGGSKWNALVKAARDAVLADRGKHRPVNEKGLLLPSQNYNDVVVDDISYLRKNFKAEKADNQKIIDDTVKDFKLNTEQERAFRIVANHATMSQPSQLKMYLGGMGGTGKSQVIKALISFFDKRKESHRIMILAPTGTAAALLNGSTYHSVLGINGAKDGDTIRNEHTLIAQVKARLDGVDYIFLDEVSMVACHDLYKISAQLAKARNVGDTPFGGINMIFAGDFAQLSPVGGHSFYNEAVGTSVDASQTLKGQQASIGKALWHQVTTVVILRQNMRQNKQSKEDAKLRTALENMRYASCTLDDIQFLRSRIAGKGQDQPNLADKQYRNVSIITAFNASKDRINQLGSERFAKETGQILTHFCSVDRFGEEENPAIEKKRKKKNRTLNNGEISPMLRNILWDLRHSASDQVPGKLSLCIGMPVMIRNNDATELCITKGQEGHIVSWQSAIGPHGQLVLDTLFVKLDQPAKTIKLDGLPENVVPLTKLSKSVLCITPSDVALKINRSQVSVLPNFAMTDYASQGKTRDINVVDLSSCRDHMSYYTCLSRGSTAEGTVIVQGFNPYKIMCGASGYLRQEFRELELLDEITRLSYEGTLPVNINGNLRNARIRQFQLYKGTEFVPANVSKQLKWTSSDPMKLLNVVTDSPWQVIKDKQKNPEISKSQPKRKEFSTHTFIVAKGTAPVQINTQITGTKRKADENLTDEHSKTKKSKLTFIPSQDTPVGITWDSENYSCAYDAIFSILCDVWIHDPKKWTKWFCWLSDPLERLAYNYREVLRGKQTLEATRNNVRKWLHNKDALLFPYGQVGTNVSELARQLMIRDKSPCYAKIQCITCNKQEHVQSPENFMHIMNSNLKSINNWFQNWQIETTDDCGECRSKQHIIRNFAVNPEILMFSLNVTGIAISKSIRIKDANDKVTMLPLKGIVYSGNFHFTCRIISDKTVWFHDGITTRSKCDKVGHITDFSDKTFMTCNNKHAVLAVYAKK